MQAIKMIGLGLMLMLPALPHAAPGLLDERALRDECSAYYSEADMRDCLANHVARSERAMSAAEGKFKTALSRWDEDKKYVDLARSRLVIAKQAFARSREAQCAFAASLGGGAIGNALDMMRLACMAELNYWRARQLEKAAAELAARQALLMLNSAIEPIATDGPRQ